MGRGGVLYELLRGWGGGSGGRGGSPVVELKIEDFVSFFLKEIDPIFKMFKI